MKFAIIIPARYKSSRFPGKPLVDIQGKSLLRHVWDKCRAAADVNSIYVATDDIRIKNHCEEQNINVLMTSSGCLTGTDRVYEASLSINAEYYINIQGDEPLIDPQDIQTIISSLKYVEKNTLINAQCTISNQNDFFNVNIPKVVSDLKGNLLYISRAPIPYNKSEQFISAKKQVCIYGFTREQLFAFYNQRNKTPIEFIEDIEILRFLEMGFKIKMVDVSNSSIAVDIPSDIEIVKKIISGRKIE